MTIISLLLSPMKVLAKRVVKVLSSFETKTSARTTIIGFIIGTGGGGITRTCMTSHIHIPTSIKGKGLTSIIIAYFPQGRYWLEGGR